MSSIDHNIAHLDLLSRIKRRMKFARDELVETNFLDLSLDSNSFLVSLILFLSYPVSLILFLIDCCLSLFFNPDSWVRWGLRWLSRCVPSLLFLGFNFIYVGINLLLRFPSVFSLLVSRVLGSVLSLIMLMCFMCIAPFALIPAALRGGVQGLRIGFFILIEALNSTAGITSLIMMAACGLMAILGLIFSFTIVASDLLVCMIGGLVGGVLAGILSGYGWSSIGDLFLLIGSCGLSVLMVAVFTLGPVMLVSCILIVAECLLPLLAIGSVLAYLSLELSDEAYQWFVNLFQARDRLQMERALFSAIRIGGVSNWIIFGGPVKVFSEIAYDNVYKPLESSYLILGSNPVPSDPEVDKVEANQFMQIMGGVM